MKATLQTVFQRYGPAYLERYGNTMPDIHRHALRAIMACRTGHYGAVLYRCQACGEHHRLGRSCGNRHCPTCQHQKTQEWLDKQLQKRLPGPHFMITFTVPEALRRFVRSHQRLAYNALFAASAHTIKVFAKDPRHVGGEAGFWGILHTWGRQLHYHPHIHYVVPGGALSQDGTRWIRARPMFFAPVKAMSRVFRGHFREKMAKDKMLDAIPDSVWTTDWNVNCQAVGESENTIRYLAGYVFKTAISNRRFLGIENDHVVFWYKRPRSDRKRIMRLEPFEFIRRFLQHVLPKGFQRLRHYGFCSSASNMDHETLCILVQLAYAFNLHETNSTPDKFQCPKPICPLCGGTMTPCKIMPPSPKQMRPETNDPQKPPGG